jgi:hypothetical protein
MPAKKKLVRAARQPRKRKPISISPIHSFVESGGDDEEVQQVLSGETEPPTIPAVVTTGGTTGSTSTATTTTGPTSTASTTTSSTATSASASLPKKRRGSGFISEAELTDREKWILDNLKFLKPYIHRVRKKTPVSVSIMEITECIYSIYIHAENVKIL